MGVMRIKMREKERINRILDLIKKEWEENPDTRFFQLMINLGLMEDTVESWNIEDDKVEKHLEGVINRK